MLSAICRLQSWKWIGAVLAVAAAGAATAAPDITDRLQNQSDHGAVHAVAGLRQRQDSEHVPAIACDGGPVFHASLPWVFSKVSIAEGKGEQPAQGKARGERPVPDLA